MATFYEVSTESGQLEAAQKFKELYRFHEERLKKLLEAEKQLLNRLVASPDQLAVSSAIQALRVEEELDRAQSILADIVAVYIGLESAKRAAPTPEGHPPSQPGYTVQTGSRTEVRLETDLNKNRNNSR